MGYSQPGLLASHLSLLPVHVHCTNINHQPSSSVTHCLHFHHQHQILSIVGTISHHVAKCQFKLQHVSPSNKYFKGWFYSLGLHWFQVSRSVSLKSPVPQFENISSFTMIHLTTIHDYWKTLIYDLKKAKTRNCIFVEISAMIYLKNQKLQCDHITLILYTLDLWTTDSAPENEAQLLAVWGQPQIF